MTAIDVSSVTPIKLALLVEAPENVRKTRTGAAHAVLKASIRAQGILQNLVVYPTDNGKFAVTAGAGRRAALLDLVKEKAITKNFEVPCLVRAREDAVALSLAENTAREAMHPVDELTAFKTLIEQGRDLEDVAAQFGVSQTVVKQRLKLASVSPIIIDAFRQNQITLNQVMGFTITDDHAKQEKVFQEIGPRFSWMKRDSIVQMLTSEKVPTSDPIFIYAGQDYTKAGGSVTADLFDDDAESYADDSGLLHRIASAKLAELADAELAKGWKWVEVNPEYSAAPPGYGRITQHQREPSTEDSATRDRLINDMTALEDLQEERDLTDAEAKEYHALSEKLDQLDRTLIGYLPEDMALAGGWLTIDNNGKPTFRGGYVKPEDRKAIDTLKHRPALTRHDDGDRENLTNAPNPETAGPKLSDNLLKMLHEARTTALRAAVANSPAKAIRLLAYHLMADAYLHTSDRVLTVSSSQPYRDDTDALTVWGDRLPGDPEELFDAIMSLADDDVSLLLAALVSAQVDASYQKADPARGHYGRPGTTADKLATEMRLDMTTVWRPTADNYFRHVSKDMVLDAVREGKGEDEAKRLASLKKGPLSIEAETVMSGVDWLPQPLRTKV